MQTVPSEALLEFWFGPREGHGKPRPEWFRKDERFDEEIRRRFAALHASAALGELESWRAEARSMLALTIALDQFSRNLYRGDPRSFSQDAHALACAREALARGDDVKLEPVERQFLYLPFEHSEDPADQDRAVELMGSLDRFEATHGLVEWAERHRAVIRRFRRFPHRNAVLGRASTPAEAEFLKEPGSRF